MANQNVPTYLQDAASTAARNAEYTGDPLSDIDGDGTYNSYLGCNRGGSNSPGLGINTGDISYLNGTDPLPEKWTLLDQAGAGRTPQESQHIGGNGLGGTLPSSGGDQSVEPVRHVIQPASAPGTVDTNDTANFVVADSVAAPGAIADTVTGTVNQTDRTTAIGDVLWGNVPVA